MCLSLHEHKASKAVEFPSFQELPNRLLKRKDAFSPKSRNFTLSYFFGIIWTSSQSCLWIAIEEAGNNVACLHAEKGLVITFQFQQKTVNRNFPLMIFENIDFRFLS